MIPGCVRSVLYEMKIDHLVRLVLTLNLEPGSVKIASLQIQLDPPVLIVEVKKLLENQINQ